jgi:hypothetical protein
MNNGNRKDFFEGVPRNKDAPSGQSFDLRDGIPPLPEDMVPFYESYIPVRLEGQPDKIAAAQEALAARDQILLETILNPSPYDAGLVSLRRRLGMSKQTTKGKHQN